MVLNGPPPGVIQDGLGENIGDESHNVQVRFQFGVLVIDFRGAHLFGLEDGHAELKRQFLQRVCPSRNIGRGVNADHLFAAFGQLLKGFFAEGGLPYQDDAHFCRLLITGGRDACGYRPSRCPV